jgi:hypothetical protein
MEAARSACIEADGAFPMPPKSDVAVNGLSFAAEGVSWDRFYSFDLDQTADGPPGVAQLQTQS